MHESGLSPFDFAEAAERRLVQSHADRLKAKGLQQLQNEKGRVDRWVLDPDNLPWRFDFTKQCVDDDAWSALKGLAEDAGWREAIECQFRGKSINATEGRAVLHMALRGSLGDDFRVRDEEVMPEVLATRSAFLSFADDVRSGAYAASDGGRFTHAINIGIGGSDLGPVMVHEALAATRLKEETPMEVRFVSNVDPSHLDMAIADLDPARTLLVIVSKTFTTQETMANAHRALAWLKGSLGEHAGHHLAAVTSNEEGAAELGISSDRVFGFGNWVGGRFSLWGPVGLAIAIGSGSQAFLDLLHGARAMDQHFRMEGADTNIPLHLALIEIWNVNFMGHSSRVVLPYAQPLHRLPAYLQQAEMESNGKAVGRGGLPVTWATHPVVWGEPGTNGQHAFHQLLHQGTELHPVDFLAFKTPMGADDHMHQLLLNNAVAQSEAFCMGRSLDAVTSEMVRAGKKKSEIDAIAPHRCFTGGRPSTFMLAEALNAHSLGALIAAHEHKIFLEGLLWNVYSYDQWGVELGKVLAKQLDEGADEMTWTPGTQALRGAIKTFH